MAGRCFRAAVVFVAEAPKMWYRYILFVGAAMRHISRLKLNAILAFGLVFILAGFFLLVNFSRTFFETFPIVSVMAIVAGIVVLYCSLTLLKGAFVFFVGFYALCVGAFALFTSSSLCPFSFAQSWPISAILCAVSLLVTSLAKYRRIKSSYAYPSVAIGFLGGAFLLFSADVVKLSFTAFMARWWPIFLVVLGIVLVVLYAIQQTPNHLPYAQDEDELGDILG